MIPSSHVNLALSIPVLRNALSILILAKANLMIPDASALRHRFHQGNKAKARSATVSSAEQEHEVY